MPIALDATYSISPQPSGIAIYSQALLNCLPAAHPEERFLFCYRPKQLRRAPRPTRSNVRKRLLLPPLPIGNAKIFHALNQRLDRRFARANLATFHDLFVIDSEYSSPEFRARFTAQARLAAANSDLLLAVSRFTADRLRDLLNVPQEKIRVVPHGVHFPNDAPPKASQRAPIILFAGALQLRKNVARLVRAFRAAPHDWTLILAGAPGGYQSAQILDDIDASPARDRIELRGYVPASELQSLYARAAIFAFPSLDEGFGIPVLEAMAHGLPVLTSNRSGTAEVAGGAALLVDPTREDDIADGLLRLIRDENLREQLATQGRERARLYSWEETCRATYAAYQSLRDG